MGVAMPIGGASLHWLSRQARPRASEPFRTGKAVLLTEALLWSEAMIPLLYFVLPTLGSYVMLSIFFLRRPHLLHTSCAPVFPICLAAHRGGELSQGVGRDGIHLEWSEPNKAGAMVGNPSSRCRALVSVKDRGKRVTGPGGCVAGKGRPVHLTGREEA